MLLQILILEGTPLAKKQCRPWNGWSFGWLVGEQPSSTYREQRIFLPTFIIVRYALYSVTHIPKVPSLIATVELLYIYIYGVIYVVLTIVITFLCSHLVSRLGGLGTLLCYK
jgi:hypothetical protein